MYIGETRRTVHERINELRQTLNRTDLMPWNDPHPAAPSLWAWQDAEGFEYECFIIFSLPWGYCDTNVQHSVYWIGSTWDISDTITVQERLDQKKKII